MRIKRVITNKRKNKRRNRRNTEMRNKCITAIKKKAKEK